jgi:hypothetical protein
MTLPPLHFKDNNINKATTSAMKWAIQETNTFMEQGFIKHPD